MDVLSSIYEMIDTSSRFVICINGLDCSGKTLFARSLRDFLEKKDLKVCIIHMDDFHNKKAYRYQGKDEAVNYYTRSFDLRKLEHELLKPIRAGHDINKTLLHLDLATDSYSVEKHYDIDDKTIVIIEGVFLLKKELLKYYDLKIFLDVSEEEVLKRATKRDTHIPSAERINRYKTKYLAGQKIYMEKHKPKSAADMIIDNNDHEKPFIMG